MDLVRLQWVYPSPVSEEEQGVVGVHYHQVHHRIVFPCPHTHNAFSAAVLGAECVGRHPFHVALLAQRDYGVFMGDE